MARGIIMCGTFVTIKVPVVVSVLGFITLIIGAVATGIGAGMDCYYGYHGYDDWCGYQRTNSLISGIVCMVTGAGCVIAALIMVVRIRKAPESGVVGPHHPVSVVQQQHPYIGSAAVLATTTTTTQYPGQYQYPQQQQQQHSPYPQQQYPPPPPTYSP